VTARGLTAALGLAAALAAQGATARALLLDPAGDREQRCRALATLQDAGQLDVPLALAALGDADEAVGAMAAAIVRHEWPELPPALLRGLDADAVAARRLSWELAWAPRPAATLWSEARTGAAPGRSPADRCLALAARGRPLSGAEARLLLQALVAHDADESWRLAAGLLPPPLADGLVGRLHGLLQAAQVEVAQVAPLFDRMTGVGVQQLLAIAAALPPATGEALCDYVAQRDLVAVRERARAALDGEAPLEPLWLRAAAPLLDQPARRERLLAVLVEAAAAPELQQRAFAALVEAQVVDERMAAWVRAQPSASARRQALARWLDAAIDRFSTAQLLEWLGAEPELATATVRALVRRSELGAEVEQVLLRACDGVAVEGPFLQPAAMALLQRGSEAAVRTLWPLLRGSPLWGEAVDALVRRRGPFAHDLLSVELTVEAEFGHEPRTRQLDDVRLGLVALGDQRQLAGLVDRASQATPTFVRRCAHHARPLPAPLALQLLQQLPTVAEPDLAGELAAWAATCDDARVVAHVQQWWQATAADDVAVVLREVALRVLVAGPQRAALVASLRAAIAAGPLPPQLEGLPFELIATMATPPTAADLRLLAELALLPPLGDPAHERELATRWPDARHGFPVLAAVGRALLGADAAQAAAAFGAVAAQVAADDRRAALSRQRFLALWRALPRDPAVLQAVGAATAELCLALPDGGVAAGAGPAHAFLWRAAHARGDHAAAARHARAAIGGLLRRAEDHQAARAFLGERDPAAGRDPWAALAAAPHLAEHLAAVARGDRAAAAAAAERTREFAGHDAATLAMLPTKTEEDPPR
jgi:hypothetical protein